jgi:hypothetical protein
MEEYNRGRVTDVVLGEIADLEACESWELEAVESRNSRWRFAGSLRRHWLLGFGWDDCGRSKLHT